MAGDIEEWKYAESGVSDPADLLEDNFLLFIRGAMPYVQTYERVNEIMYADNGLLLLLQNEVRLRGQRREIERFERAFRRLSRVMLSVLTEGLEQRVAQLAAAEDQDPRIIEATDRFRRAGESAAAISQESA